MEPAPLAVRPLVADLPAWSRLVDTNGHRPALRAEKPLLDQPRLGVGAVNRLGGCREPSGHNYMFVAFGLKRHLAHGTSFRSSDFMAESSVNYSDTARH